MMRPHVGHTICMRHAAVSYKLERMLVNVNWSLTYFYTILLREYRETDKLAGKSLD